MFGKHTIISEKAKDNRGVIELQSAARQERLREIVEERGVTKLIHQAAENGNEGLLKIVLDDPKIDVNARLDASRVEAHDLCKGCTALILACWKGHTKIVEEILLRGADVHICLHVVAFSGHVEVVNFLFHGKSERDPWEDIATSATGLAMCVTVLCLFLIGSTLSLNPSSSSMKPLVG
ncbi:unnamed protein product [Calypogeia fissa]